MCGHEIVMIVDAVLWSMVHLMAISINQTLRESDGRIIQNLRGCGRSNRGTFQESILVFAQSAEF
jgi:hypothetical protein